MGSTLNLDDNDLVLTFSAIDANSPVNCSNIRLGSTATAPTADTYPLSDPVVLDSTANTVECRLGAELQVAIKTDASFGTATADTFVFFDAGNGIENTMVPVPASAMGTGVTLFLLDNSPPELMSFVEFNLNQGILIFSFTEVVNVSSLNFTDLTLQSDFVSNVGESFTLTGGVCNNSMNCDNSDVVSFRITDEDLNEIKLLRDLCTSQTDCVPTYTSLFVMDFTSRGVTAYNQNDPTQHQLRSFVPDTSGPQLVAFDVNLSTDELTLEFNEPVSAASFDPSGFVLQATSVGGNQVPLTTSTVAPTADNVTFTLSLGGDAHSLKLAPFATSESDTFISVSVTAIDDLYGNSVAAINRNTAQQVRIFINDTAPPTVASFSLDLDSNRLLVTFSEPVYAATISTANFTLTNGSASNILDLSGSSLVDVSGNPAQNALLVVGFMLDGDTLTSIKTDSTIGSETANTVLEVLPLSFDDTSNNTNIAMQTIVDSTVIPDTTQATVLDFSLDMNIGQIVLTFDDVIDVSSARLIRRTITVQDAETSTSFYELTGGDVLSNDSTTVVISITNTDLLALKANLNVATQTVNSYLTIEAEAFRDLRGADIIPITDSNAIMTENFTADSTPPMLDSFDFDLDAGQLIMSFDEPIDVNSFVFDRMIIQDVATNDTMGIALQGGSTNTAAFQTLITFFLTRADLNAIKADTNIATSTLNTYLRLVSGAVNDTAGNPVAATGNESVVAIPVRLFSPDITSPTIESFILDLNLGELRVTFDETINITTFVQTSLILQNSSLSGATELQLTGGRPTTVISATVNITLLNTDLNFIKLQPSFGETISNTYIRALAAVVSDMSGNVAGAGRAVMASNVIPDMTPPLLSRFILDLSRDEFRLTFNEPVNASSLVFTLFTLYNTSDLMQGAIPLSGTFDPVDSTDIVVQIPLSLALTIKNTPLIATARSDTFLAHASDAVADIAGNRIVELITGLQAIELISDNTGPLIDSFSFDLNSGILTLNYSEPVNPATFDGLFVTIQDNTTAVVSYTLTGGTPVETSFSNTLNVQVLADDLNAIKANTSLATFENNTYLVLGSGALQDSFGNQVADVPDGSAIMVTVFTPDTTPPNVTTFDLRNADDGIALVLVVVFSETVNASTVNPTSFTLFESPGSTNNLTLTGGTVSSTNAAEIAIFITPLLTSLPFNSNIPWEQSSLQAT